MKQRRLHDTEFTKPPFLADFCNPRRLGPEIRISERKVIVLKYRGTDEVLEIELGYFPRKADPCLPTLRRRIGN